MARFARTRLFGKALSADGGEMPVEMAIWRMTEEGPQPLTYSSLDSEKRLEDMVVSDPSLTGLDIMVVGRQVHTAYGGIIDVLAADIEGRLHVVELKRDKTPREVVAQTLDYGSWVADLGLEDVTGIYGVDHDIPFDEAFAERFGTPVPDVFNADQQFTIVASELDPASERIVSFLSERYSVPLNAAFFRYFADGNQEYLGRTWLMAPDEAETARPKASNRKFRPWNGTDFYVVQGRMDDEVSRWDMARKYGFVGAGGGSWYWKPLRNLKPDHRVFAYVGGAGYVGVGLVTGGLIPLREVMVQHNGTATPLVEESGVGEKLRQRALSMDEDETEFVVPVKWLAERPDSQAVKAPGLFSSQVTVCRLKDERTIEIVTREMGIS